VPYLIDGHNLIPKVPGLSLRSLDDELELIQLLQQFCLQKRQKIEVFFDKAAPGMSGSRQFGLVSAHFVHASSNADSAIRQRLKKLGRQARNWKVVSSDHQVQAEAQAVHAEVISSEEFARILITIAAKDDKSQPPASENTSEPDIEEWLKLFNGKK
jgi:uncharacterized protein